mgnify:CR=1 FL=1
MSNKPGEKSETYDEGYYKIIEVLLGRDTNRLIYPHAIIVKAARSKSIRAAAVTRKAKRKTSGMDSSERGAEPIY